MEQLGDIRNTDIWFSLPGDAGHHCHRLNGESPHSGLTGKHHAVGAIEDGVGDIGRLGACRARVNTHRLEHMCGSDHRFPEDVRLPDNVFLGNSHLFDWDFDTQIAACHHDPVAGLQDGIQVLERLGTFDLSNDEGVVV